MDLQTTDRERGSSDQAEVENTTAQKEANSSNLSSPTRDYPGRLNELQSSATNDIPSDSIQPIQTKPLEQLNGIENENPKNVMEAFDWDDLEERYTRRMNECEETERAILTEFYNWVKVVNPFIIMNPDSRLPAELT